VHYPKLRRLCKHFSPEIISMFDSWLHEKKGYFGPSQFAKCGVDEATALRLFAYAAQPDINVLDVYYRGEYPEHKTPKCPGRKTPENIYVIFHKRERRS